MRHFHSRVWSGFAVAALIASLGGCGAELEVDELGQSLSVSFSNAGFESDWSGWTRVGHTGLSTVAHSGTTSGKVSASDGEIVRTVGGLSSNTRYALSAWVRGNARIGVRDFGRWPVSTTADTGSDWRKLYVTFSTDGDHTSAELYVAWAGGGDARVDDVVVAPAPSGEASGAEELDAAAVEASTSDGTHVARYAADGSSDTHWSGRGDGAWLQVDLGAVQTVSYVDVGVYAGTSRRNRFDLQVSSDGSSWSTVWSGESSGTTRAKEGYAFDDVSARYLRYVGHGSTVSSWNSVTELAVFGQRSSTTASAPATTSPSTPPASCALPSGLIDLSSWKLQIPVGSPTEEIKQPVLADYSVSPYFRVNSDCTGVRFRAPTDGTTTSGAEYPRSELREMTADGSDKAAWSTTSGTHRMFIDQKVTALPRGKGMIAIGQIHNGLNDVIMVRLEGSKLLVKPNGSSGHVLDSSYTLGKRFTVELVVHDGDIDVYYNGGSQPEFTYHRETGNCYFKAGAYTQSNCATEAEYGETCGADNYGEVQIFDVWTRHSS